MTVDGTAAVDLRSQGADLFRVLVSLPHDDPRREEVREALVVLHQPLVRSLAQRYAGRGEPLDDLVQAGTVGLIQAIDRIDAERLETATGYLVATVLGEIRRHFRDRTWGVRVPRRLQELSRAVAAARRDLEQDLGRSPTVAELAERVGAGVDDVLDALEAGQAYAPDSLDAGADDGGAATPAAPGAEDRELAAVLHRTDLARALARLDADDRALLHERFVNERSQAAIAADLGVDQSQVSRRLARILTTLRAQVEVQTSEP